MNDWSWTGILYVAKARDKILQEPSFSVAERKTGRMVGFDNRWLYGSWIEMERLLLIHSSSQNKHPCNLFQHGYLLPTSKTKHQCSPLRDTELMVHCPGAPPKQPSETPRRYPSPRKELAGQVPLV